MLLPMISITCLAFTIALARSAPGRLNKTIAGISLLTVLLIGIQSFFWAYVLIIIGGFLASYYLQEWLIEKPLYLLAGTITSSILMVGLVLN